MIDEPIGRIVHAGHDLHRHGQPGRQRQRKAGRAPDQPHRVVEEQDQPEGRQHLVEMVAAVEMPERHEFQHDAEQQRGAERQQRCRARNSGPGHEGRREIGAHHVERAVREIDEVHDAEHQRQPCRQQEQQQAELQAVQRLFDDDQHEPLTRAVTKQRQRDPRRRLFVIGRMIVAEPSPGSSSAARRRSCAGMPTITSSGICRGSDPGCP